MPFVSSSPHTQRGKFTDQPRPLMLANKDTGRLAREVYYGDNRFILDNNPINYVQNWQNFRTPHPAQKPWIRNLELHMYAWGMEPDEDVQSDEVQKYELSWPRELRQHSLLHHLFEPLSGGMRKEDKRGYMCHAYSTDTKRPIVKSMMSASWQNGFTGVRDLKIVLIGSPCFTNIHGFPYGRRKPEGAVGRLSSRVRIPMSARRVEVVLKKGEKWTSRTCCSELCPEIFKSLVESLVHIRTGAEEKADDAI